MPRILYSLPLWLLTGLLACNSNNRDPVADAKFQNEQRIKEENITERQQRDADFLVETAAASQLQVEMGKMVQTKALSPDLRTLGQQLVRDHGEMLNALRALATRKNIVLPEALGNEQQEAYRDLMAQTGAEFDRRYVERVVERHDDVTDTFDDLAKDAYDGDVRAFAAKYTPTLQAHHQRAEQLQEALKK